MADLTATIQQCGEEIDWQDTFMVITQSFIGPDDDIDSMAYNTRKGTTKRIHGAKCTIESCRTTKLEADRSRLTYTGRGVLSSASEDNIISETWSVNMAQLEVPLYKYCSPEISSATSVEYGNASYLRAWENETNGELKANYKFKYFDDNSQSNVITELSGMTKTLAEAINSGVESRICFYPQMTRTTVCYDFKELDDIEEREKALNLIDPTPQTLISSLYSQTYSWLKSSFDISKNSDNTYTLAESWIGTPPYLGEWNEGMYSADDKKRWRMYGGGISSNNQKG